MVEGAIAKLGRPSLAIGTSKTEIGRVWRVAEFADWVLVFKPTIASLTMKKIHIEKDTKSAHPKRKTVLSVSSVFRRLTIRLLAIF